MSETDATNATLGRRSFLKGTAGGVAAAAGVSAAAPASAAPPSFGGWMSDANNYGKVVDARGKSTVTIEVGVEASNGPYAFGPAAVKIDPGTTVVWKWTGKGSHNVVAKGGGFESKLTSKKGFTFEHIFEETGVHKYYCSPHKRLGMKGVVVVAESSKPAGASSDGANTGYLGSAAGGVSTGELLLGGGVVAALLGAVGIGIVRSEDGVTSSE